MRSKRNLPRGFTLTEIMVAMTIFGFVVAGSIPFFINNLKTQYVGGQKFLINADIRKVTNQMVENAREANTFVMYQAFTLQNRWDGATETRDANGINGVTFADRLQGGSSGDFVVLIFYADPYWNAALYDGDTTNNLAIPTATINRMVGYWVAPNRNVSGENAIYMFDTDRYRGTASTWTTSWGATFPAALSPTAPSGIEALLPPATSAYAQAAEFPILINNASGLSNGYTFFNYLNKSIITRAKILHGNLAKRVTNTYNFTITPRG